MASGRHKTRAPFESNVSSKYGSPMGRRSDDPRAFAGVVRAHLVRVPLYDGCYDKGGAYWGGPADLWCAWGDDDEEQRVSYLRAPSREAAKAKFPPGVKWHK